jgi:glycine cleavage system regulatory protein
MARRTRRPLLALLAGAALALGLAGCTGSQGDAGSSSPEGGSGGAAEPAPGGATPEGGAADEGGGTDLAGATQATDDREVVTRGTATVVAADPVAAAQDLARMVEEAGGRVEQRDEQRAADGEPASARLTVRVPADRVTSTVEALDALGEVVDVSISKEDVTAAGRDLDARVAALETSTTRLRELMGSAADTADLLAVEKELADRQADLDALRAQREALSDQVAMSTLEVWLTGADAAPAATRAGFTGGLAAGWAALVVTARTVLVVLGAALPWLAVAGVLALAGRGVARAVRTRRGAADEPAVSP